MATINDIVLIYMEESPVSFARIESILPDSKKDWYHIKLLMLQIPLQVVTWILKDEYINGEQFNMNGKQMKLKKVECPIDELTPLETQTDNNLDTSSQTPQSPAEKKEPKEATIISFPGLKKE